MSVPKGNAGEETVDVAEAKRDPLRRPSPHGDKLRELLKNPKVPVLDRPKVQELLEHYENWIARMSSLDSQGEERVRELVDLLNEYKLRVEIDLIWDSDNSFLHRQKGQLKLDNSVLEEWFPWLIDPVIMPELRDIELAVGPAKAFAAAYFQSVLTDVSGKPRLAIRSKDQDFTIGRPVFMKASFDPGFGAPATDDQLTYLAYIAAELKTNLDKTMFQEASATSHDLKIAAPGSHYFLICEYLDMTPIRSAGTDITEVLVLRGKRTGSQHRKNHSDAEYRRMNRDVYVEQLRSAPIRLGVVQRFVDRVRAILQHQIDDLSDAAERGYF
ncbi:Bpu10I family restriction endonuclease [Streptomyces sp. NBC_01187]|uniref:Bpu10I family restriction endonuclease n=1 Tax=Streptomyces sp. NBC_01187 TaxID=2903766 RepID=UPI00386542C4|nr:Bpu10I family restriction endonuclease [Streptomyces sp. NBC_01187]